MFPCVNRPVDSFVRRVGTVAAGIAMLVGTSVAVLGEESPFRFKLHVADPDMPGRHLGQTVLADLDKDGDLDFVVGQMYGDIFWYEYGGADAWVRHDLGKDSPSGVGAVAYDVNSDGWLDIIAGGAWYENPQSPREREFIRHRLDANLLTCHDMFLADLTGNGKPDVVSMSDKNDVRWYAIPDDPFEAWPMTYIGPAVHAGISPGDIDGDGDLDVVRSNVWFENLGEGKRWEMHTMTESWGASEPKFAVNATRTAPIDLNDDGRLDIVICDNENPNSKFAWLEAPEEPRTGEWIINPMPRGDDAPRGALHTLRLADFDNNGRRDIFTVEMDEFPGARPPRWFIWENLGNGELKEHVILDINLGGHEAVAADVDGDGDIDICGKPWNPEKIGGKGHFFYLENLTVE